MQMGQKISAKRYHEETSQEVESYLRGLPKEIVLNEQETMYAGEFLKSAEKTKEICDNFLEKYRETKFEEDKISVPLPSILTGMGNDELIFHKSQIIQDFWEHIVEICEEGYDYKFIYCGRILLLSRELNILRQIMEEINVEKWYRQAVDDTYSKLEDFTKCIKKRPDMIHNKDKRIIFKIVETK